MMEMDDEHKVDEESIQAVISAIQDTLGNLHKCAHWAFKVEHYKTAQRIMGAIENLDAVSDDLGAMTFAGSEIAAMVDALNIGDDV